MCLNIGTPNNHHFPFGTNEKVVVLGVPILKHFRVFEKSDHFVWSSVDNSIVKLVVLKVFKKPFSAQNLKATEHSSYIRSASLFFLILQILRPSTIHFILYGQSVCDSKTFQEFAYIVKYCPFLSPFGTISRSSISYKQKKIALVFRTYEYPKRCAGINIYLD